MPTMSTQDQETTTASVPPRRLALLIGVNGPPTPERPALDHATADALNMGQALQETYCNFTLFQPTLLGEQATTEHVRTAILDLADELREDDFALFYFSGHADM